MNKDVAILHASVKLLIIRRIPLLPNVTKNIRRSRSNMSSYVVRSQSSIVRMFYFSDDQTNTESRAQT